jgi:hypothetical protein
MRILMSRIKIPVPSNLNWYMLDFYAIFFLGIRPMVVHDHFKDNFKNNYLIFKLNYFICFSITASLVF